MYHNLPLCCCCHKLHLYIWCPQQYGFITALYYCLLSHVGNKKSFQINIVIILVIIFTYVVTFTIDIYFFIWFWVTIWCPFFQPEGIFLAFLIGHIHWKQTQLLCLFAYALISPLLLKGGFAVYKILDWQGYFFLSAH